jgi:type IV secretory pathway TrbF-like protein
MALFKKLFGKERRGESDSYPEQTVSDAERDPRRAQAGNSWIDAVNAYDDRMMRLAAHVVNWQRMAYLSLLFSFCCLAVVVYAIHIPKLEPIPIAVDKLGTSVVVKDSRPDAALLAKQEYSEVGDFIENCRTVLGDKMGLRRLQARCYSRLPDDAAARRWYVDHTKDGNDPFVIGQNHSVEATVTTRLKLSDANWEIEWQEQSIDLNGGKMGSPVKYKAHLTVQFQKGTDSISQLEQNPNGFYVKTLSWAKQM